MAERTLTISLHYLAFVITWTYIPKDSQDQESCSRSTEPGVGRSYVVAHCFLGCAPRAGLPAPHLPTAI